jgi:hypothetical protein
MVLVRDTAFCHKCWKQRHKADSQLPFRLMIVGGLVLGLLLLFLVCAGISYFGLLGKSGGGNEAGAAKDARAAAESFIADLRSGNVNAAWGKTSAGFKKRQNLQQFSEFVGQHAYLKGYKDKSANIAKLTEATAYAFHTVQAGDEGEASVTVDVIKEGGVWKVDVLSIE